MEILVFKNHTINFIQPGHRFQNPLIIFPDQPLLQRIFLHIPDHGLFENLIPDSLTLPEQINRLALYNRRQKISCGSALDLPNFIHMPGQGKKRFLNRILCKIRVTQPLIGQIPEKIPVCFIYTDKSVFILFAVKHAQKKYHNFPRVLLQNLIQSSMLFLLYIIT